MRFLITTLFLTLTFAAFSQTHPVLQLGIKDSLQSQVLKEKRQYWVYLPASYYDQSIQPMQYPVLYVLDGNIHFHSLTGMVEILSGGSNSVHVLPEMIIVSILNTERLRDFTPTHSLKSIEGKDAPYFNSSGGGDNFLSFLEQELFPKIESSYRTLPFRSIIGHSFGGLEVLHALMNRSQLFNSYVAIDPSLWWDNRSLLQKMESGIKKINLANKYLFLAQANSFFAKDPRGNPHFDAIKSFSSILETEKPVGLKWKFKYYENDNHGSVAFAAEYDALRFIFAGYHARFDSISNAKELAAHYRQYSMETNVNFLPPEKVVNEFAGIASYFNWYDLVEEYYQMNINNYPKSAGAYENLGQFYVARGNKSKALVCYQNFATACPTNESAKSRVKELQSELNNKK